MENEGRREKKLIKPLIRKGSQRGFMYLDLLISVLLIFFLSTALGTLGRHSFRFLDRGKVEEKGVQLAMNYMEDVKFRYKVYGIAEQIDRDDSGYTVKGEKNEESVHGIVITAYILSVYMGDRKIVTLKTYLYGS